jgi:hypothetical protein
MFVLFQKMKEVAAVQPRAVATFRKCADRSTSLLCQQGFLQVLAEVQEVH